MSTPAFHVSFQRQLPAKRTRANRPFRAIANKVKYLSAKTHVHFYLLSATCSRDLRLRVHSPVLQDTKAVASMKGWPRLPLGESDGPHHVQSSMHAQLEHWMVPLYITHPRPHSMRSTTTLVRRTGSGFALIRPHFTAIPSIPHFLALFFSHVSQKTLECMIAPHRTNVAPLNVGCLVRLSRRLQDLPTLNSDKGVHM